MHLHDGAFRRSLMPWWPALTLDEGGPGWARITLWHRGYGESMGRGRSWARRQCEFMEHVRGWGYAVSASPQGDRVTLFIDADVVGSGASAGPLIERRRDAQRQPARQLPRSRPQGGVAVRDVRGRGDRDVHVLRRPDAA